MNNSSEVSIVIPTRNRLNSLTRSLNSISAQTYAPREIIIVDSSDNPLSIEQFDTNLGTLNVQIHHTHPSVCYQRNYGIEKSISKFILLLDDDIELSSNYIETLMRHFEFYENETVCSGLILENRNNKWNYCETQKSMLGIYMAYIFGLSVGFDFYEKTTPKNPISRRIHNAFIKNGNSISKAGWPRFVDFRAPSFKTPIYSLGASVIRSDKLKCVHFDTAFYENGIGENYDLLMSLDSEVKIITDVKAYHHKEKSNRLQSETSYYYRIAALHYILLKHKKFTFVNQIYLIWSLVGNSILFLGKGKIKMLWYNLEVILRIFFHFPLYKSKQ